MNEGATDSHDLCSSVCSWVHDGFALGRTVDGAQRWELRIRGGHHVGVIFSHTDFFGAASRAFCRPTWILGMSVASLGAASAAVFQNFPALCLACLLSGGATGATMISLQRHVGRISKDHAELKLAFSWLAIGPAISNFIGPFCAGVLIDYMGYQAAFIFLAILPLMAWFGVRHEVSKEPQESAPRDRSESVWDLLGIAMLRRLLYVNLFMSSCWDVHTFVVPLLGHERGISASAIGTIMGVFALCAALIRFVLPAIAQRLTEWQIMTISMFMTGVMMGVYSFLNAAWMMAICSGVLGLFLGAVQPMLMSTMHQITPEHRQGEALGVRLMMVNASSVFMPMLFGMVGTLIGVKGLFWCVSAAVTSGSSLAWGLRSDKNL
jgi:predicted MFS family arabinose efflux permease